MKKQNNTVTIISASSLPLPFPFIIKSIKMVRKDTGKLIIDTVAFIEIWNLADVLS